MGLARQIETLAAASVGGALAARLGVPAGWLSGAMMAAAILTASGRGDRVSEPVRLVALAMAGLSLGSGVTPAMLAAFGRYPASLALMTASLVAGTWLSATFLRRVCGWNRPTAFLATVPGALSYVLAVAPGLGADVARVSLVQLARLFALVAVVPVLAGSGAHHLASVASEPETPGWIALILVAGVPLGFLLERLGVGAGMMFGPMVVAAVTHGGGWAVGRPPDLILAAGQVLVGAWSGSRFRSFDAETFMRSIWPVFAALAITVSVAAAFAWATTLAAGVGKADALIAFAPGGIEAMTMLALALGLDPLYVGAHHLGRFFMITLAMPFIAPRLREPAAQASPHDDAPDDAKPEA